jgi:hypothetical protein
MADLKISALPASTTPLAGTEVLPIVQSGTTKQVSVANLTAGRDISATSVTASTGSFVVGTSGQGVDFSATPGTGTSELLDDYEEGTFSPTISSGITGVTYSTQNGSYTKIGRLVTFALRLELSAGTAAAAILRIGNLPFTSESTFRGYAGSWGYAGSSIINSTSTNLPTLNIDAGGTTIAFYNTAGSAFNGTDLATASGFSVDLFGSYYTT